MSLILDEHRHYLADQPRLAAFEAAIAETVREGDVVLDLAAGTGILGLLACRAGARRVYAIEAGPIVGLAREIARANGCGDRIIFVQELSTRAELPERVDAILTDQIGRFGFDAGLLEYLPDARRRFLRPGGRVVPASVDLWIAAVEHDEQWSRVAFWHQRPAGFDVRPAQRIAVNTGYPLRLERAHLLSMPQAIGSLALDAPSDTLDATRTLIVDRGGVVHGLGGGFLACLAPGATLSNSPLDDQRIRRRNVFLPFERPAAVSAGDQVETRLRVKPLEMIVTWQGTIRDEAGTVKETFRGSTFHGMLVDPSGLRRTDPAFVPSLTPAGAARRSILDLCDGQRTLADIEAEVFRRHETLFGTPDHAAAFVAEVITHYAR